MEKQKGLVCYALSLVHTDRIEEACNPAATDPPNIGKVIHQSAKNIEERDRKHNRIESIERQGGRRRRRDVY